MNSVNNKAYAVLVFYGLLCMLTAFLGSVINRKDGKTGFSVGYLVGVLISVILWMTVGSKMMN
jgi:hypothetical protein